jgi:hypothetical protein
MAGVMASYFPIDPMQRSRSGVSLRDLIRLDRLPIRDGGEKPIEILAPGPGKSGVALSLTPAWRVIPPSGNRDGRDSGHSIH